MDNRIIDFVRNLGEEYSLVVDRVLENPLVITELINLLKANGDLKSVKEMISSLEPQEGLLKDAKDVELEHAYLTSDLAIFMHAFGAGPDPGKHFKQEVERQKRERNRY